MVFLKIFKPRKTGSSTASGSSFSTANTNTTGTSFSSASTSSPTALKIGEIPQPRQANQRITPLELREFRELLQYRYALDIELWGLRDALEFQRDKVQEKMRNADAALERLQVMVEKWDRGDLWSTTEEWQRWKKIKGWVLEGGKRRWLMHPPWLDAGVGG
ncbi:hypothetical protein GQ43DRAFT_440976 [Delitschia confertaspora ATCC 74209]|uniref:Uncharacterized protein n=1 Tax=Delitschia confertaspora ATCC 74209 TaxID=1513339 RepID=A0A9P4JKC6_9PLEO|nr:hypothetical protein GQ43DRAFT_440976 [Delitschia confertaspora ATCC 74209]